jgi:hypothetical protein
VNGTLVARASGITQVPGCAIWLHADRRVRPVLGDHRLAGKSPGGSRQPDGGLEPDPGCFYGPGPDGGWGCLRFSYAERDRSCPLRASDSRCHADPARTKDTSSEGAPASPITPNATPMAQAKLSSTGVADSVTPLA